MDSRTARIVAGGVRHQSQGYPDGTLPHNSLWDQAEVWEIVATRLEQEEAKAGLFAPFRAWVVVNADGERYGHPETEQKVAAQSIAYFDYTRPDDAPHRVVPVLVTPVKEGG